MASVADDAAATSDPGPAVLQFSEDNGPDGTLHFQIVNLGRQIFAWVALNDARLDSLAAAFPPASQGPGQFGVASELLDPHGDHASGAVGRRLAKLAGVPVACCVGVPAAMTEVVALAERRLAQEIRRLSPLHNT